MANSENVKIKINEIDNTKAGGRGMDTSDIAFIPGFSREKDAVFNLPTLCTSVDDFEKAFGKQPYILKESDVTEEFAALGFIAGDVDRSYVYAKELLYEGLPVVYTAVQNTRPTETQEYSNSGVAISEVSSWGPYEHISSTPSSIDVRVNEESSQDPETGETHVTYNGFSINTNDTSGTVVVRMNYHLPMDAEQDSDYMYHYTTLWHFNPNGYSGVKLIRVHFNNEAGMYYDTEIVADNVVKTTFRGDSSVWGVDDYVELTYEVEGSLTSYDINPEDAICKVIPPKSIIDCFYDSLPDQLKMLEDRNEYSVKYITTGGYPSIKATETGASLLVNDLIPTAKARGDAVALVDYQLDTTNKLFDASADSNSIYWKIASLDLPDGEYGSAFYPWAPYACANTLTSDIVPNPVISMPASFAYLKCLARAIKTGPNWLAMAGVSRGVVPAIQGLLTKDVLTNTVAEEMQPKFGINGQDLSINCITNIRPYGLTIWGNRTLKPMGTEGAVALNFLNTRNMVSDIKKVLYSTAKSLMFEQNSEQLWLRFKSKVSPLLNQLKTGNGISDYKIIKGTTKYNGDPLQKGELSAVIKIYPLYAIEYFELTVEINDEDVAVS